MRFSRRQLILVVGPVVVVMLIMAAGATWWLQQRHHDQAMAAVTAAQAKAGNQQAMGSTTGPAASAGTAGGSQSAGANGPAGGTSGTSNGSGQSGGTGTTSGGGSGSSGGSGGSSGGTTAPATKHYSANTNYNQSLALSLGFTVLDITGSTGNPSNTKAIVDALPSGVQALVWTGNLDNTNCATPGFTTAQFQALVAALAGDSKVFGYFLSDEPHPGVCPNAAGDIKARADYIHAHDSNQKAFIVVLDGSNQCGGNLGCEYNALQPANSHVDLIGLDPYPCHYDTNGVAVACDNTKINTAVSNAIANGISLSAIVPVFQTFGQLGRTDGSTVYYRTPSSSELTTMLNTWAGLVPKPAMDYAYTFGVQCSASCPAPQALANQSALQAVIKTHNGL